MSLRGVDIDSDGDEDIVYSDRKGPSCGVGWLENPGDESDSWKDHLIGGKGLEVMFLDILKTDGQIKIACNTRNGHILDLTPSPDIRQRWTTTRIQHPPNAGRGKPLRLPT